MDLIDNKTLFNTTSFSKYEIKPVPKYVETRGFIYVLTDKSYPEYVKIGRTQNIVKRLTIYNSDKPFPSAELIAVSKEFNNVIEVEKTILDQLYKDTTPTTLTREWFEMSNFSYIISLIKEAEEKFH